MAVMLTQANLTKFKNSFSAIQDNIRTYESALAKLEADLSNNIGREFNANYEKGRANYNNIMKLIELLKAEKSDLENLVQRANYYVSQVTIK